MSHRWLMTILGPQQGTHPLMADDFLHLETVLQLTEQALQYLLRQKPCFLEDTLGPAFAQRCVNLHNTLLEGEETAIPDTPVVCSLTLVHHRNTLPPAAIAKLEQFVLNMPSELHDLSSSVALSARVPSCCWLRGPAGSLPLYWCVMHDFTFHRQLAGCTLSQ